MTVVDERVRRQLRKVGATDADIDVAAEQGRLHLLALERSLLPRTRSLTLVEAAAAADLDLETAARFVRAMAFPETPPDAKVFTEEDVREFALIKRLLDEGGEVAAALQFARVLGSAMARVAESEVGYVRSRLPPRPGGEGDDAAALLELVSLIPTLVASSLPATIEWMDYTHRRHLLAAAERSVDWETGMRSGTASTTVGFADLVGFTELSRRLEERALAEVVDRFEEVAYGTIERCSGRVVKTIGDAVMFVAGDPADAVEIAVTLTEAYAEEETLSDVRVGLATGQVLSRDGDFFGPVVNLASRLTSIALPGTVLASDGVHDALGYNESFAWTWLGPRRIKGLGPTRVWAVRRSAEPPPPSVPMPLKPGRKQLRRMRRNLRRRPAPES